MLIPLKKYPNYTIAYIDKGRLESNNIICSVEFDRIGNIPEITGNFMSGVTLMVGEKHYEEAKKIIEEMHTKNDTSFSNQDKENIKKKLQEIKEKEETIQNKKLKNSPHNKIQEKENAFQYFHLPLEFITYIVVFLFIGRFADTRIESSPIGILLGLFIGLSLGLYHIIKKSS